LVSGTDDQLTVEVTNCFCVPHKEYEERVEADLAYAKEMFDLNKKVTTQVNLGFLKGLKGYLHCQP
jgi:translation initiation factor 3 subunit F